MRLLIPAMLLAAHVATPIAAAQSGHTTIVVGAGDEMTGAFLPNVHVRIQKLGAYASTDSMGEAHLRHVPPGIYMVEARRVGYEPLSAPVRIQKEDSLEVVMMMLPTAYALPSVSVKGEAVSAHLSEFESRRKRDLGQFVTSAQLDSMFGASLNAIISSRVRGLSISGEAGPGGQFAISTRGGCSVVVYLDGVPLAPAPPDLGWIDPAWLGGIEYYNSSEIPVQYKATPSTGGSVAGKQPMSDGPECGVLLLWSR